MHDAVQSEIVDVTMEIYSMCELKQRRPSRVFIYEICLNQQQQPQKFSIKDRKKNYEIPHGISLGKQTTHSSK